jgi:hypothetical protein
LTSCFHDGSAVVELGSVLKTPHPLQYSSAIHASRHFACAQLIL